MTPDDVAAIKARISAVLNMDSATGLALCDALEAALAERDARYTGQELKLERINRKNAEKRADRAEAEVSRLVSDLVLARKERDGYQKRLDIQVAHTDRQATALARVRALCDNARGRHAEGCCGYLMETEIRDAIEGDSR